MDKARLGTSFGEGRNPFAHNVLRGALYST